MKKRRFSPSAARISSLWLAGEIYILFDPGLALKPNHSINNHSPRRWTLLHIMTTTRQFRSLQSNPEEVSPLPPPPGRPPQESRLHYFSSMSPTSAASSGPSTTCRLIKSLEVDHRGTDREGENLCHIKSVAFYGGGRKEAILTHLPVHATL